MIDWVVLMESAGDRDLAMSYLAMFRRDLKEKWPEVQRLAEQQRWQEMESPIHALGGGASYCGFKELSHRCSVFVNILRGQQAGDLKQAWDAVKDCKQDSRRALDEALGG